MKPCWQTKYPTRDEIRSTVMMMVQPVEIECRFMYPIPLIKPENQFEDILFCQAVYGEGRGEGLPGWREIAQVIINRWKMNKSYFGFTIREIITKNNGNGIYQFNALNPDDKNYKAIQKPDEITWFQIVRAVLPIYCEMSFSYQNPCLYYKHKNIPDEGFWNKLRFVKEVGNHRFYTEKI